MKISLKKKHAAIANCFLIYLILLGVIIFALSGCTSTPTEINAEWQQRWQTSKRSWIIDYCETRKDCELARKQLEYFHE